MSKEFVDRKGDRWVVRECDDDDHCIVVERRLLRDNGTFSEEPVDDFHILLESLGDLIEALRTIDKD